MSRDYEGVGPFRNEWLNPPAPFNPETDPSAGAKAASVTLSMLRDGCYESMTRPERADEWKRRYGATSSAGLPPEKATRAAILEFLDRAEDAAMARMGYPAMVTARSIPDGDELVDIGVIRTDRGYSLAVHSNCDPENPCAGTSRLEDFATREKALEAFAAELDETIASVRSKAVAPAP